MGKILLIVTWIPSALASIFASLFLLHYLTSVREANTLLRMKSQEILPMNQIHFFAALPKVLGTFTSTIKTGDARPEIIRTFLNQYNSPLADYAPYIVKVADRYNVDYRLISAIAVQESGGCKHIPENSYNCWGYGVYGNQVVAFDNFEDGIDVVTKNLRERYIEAGLVNPQEIMKRYTPNSPEGAWAKSIEHFMEKMQ